MNQVKCLLKSRDEKLLLAWGRFWSAGERDGGGVHRLFTLNVLGLLLSPQAGVKLMSKGGSVINIGSLAGSMPAAYGSIYSATKAAVNNLSISLSKELGPKQIRVNALNPGLVLTEGLQAAGFMKGEMYENAV
jgi:3-oxoacyl-[acyl-carrier protein] reductase